MQQQFPVPLLVPQVALEALPPPPAQSLVPLQEPQAALEALLQSQESLQVCSACSPAQGGCGASLPGSGVPAELCSCAAYSRNSGPVQAAQGLPSAMRSAQPWLVLL